MSLGDAALTFVSVFVAALLAFYLDGLRERRATRAWVKEYLGFRRATLEADAEARQSNDAMLARIDDALAAWLRGDEPDWTYVDAVNFNSSFTFTADLLGTAVGVVPPDLMRRMYGADATAPALRRTAEFAARLFESEIRPMALGREVALDARQRRAVELYRSEFANVRDLQRGYVVQLDEILRELVRAGF